MQAILLSAGLGLRLRPITETIPKVMIPIDGKPLLLREIELLKKHDIKRFIINTHWLPDKITDFFGDGKKFGVEIKYTYEKTILGDAGGVKNCENLLDKNKSFLVLYGDLMIDVKINKLIDFHNKHKPLVTIGVLPEDEHLKEKGVVEVDKNNGIRIVGFEEKPDKPKSNLISGGIFVFDPKILKYIPVNKFCMLGKDVFPKIVQKYKICAWPVDGRIKDILVMKKKILRL
jgi:mannose-1-phosphate guanylyltransferase